MKGNSNQATSEVVLWRIDEWFGDLDKGIREKLKGFHTELLHFNQKLSLISSRTGANADQVHFADGILGMKSVLGATDAKEIHDLGSGNGIPGLIGAIIAPSRKFVLVDSDTRKIEFIKHVVARLALTNVKVFLGRIEDLPDGSIQCAVTRGLATITKVVLICRKGCMTGGQIFHFKGDTWSRELAEIPSQVLAFWEPAHVGDYVLPLTSTKLSIVSTKRRQ